MRQQDPPASSSNSSPWGDYEHRSWKSHPNFRGCHPSLQAVQHGCSCPVPQAGTGHRLQAGTLLQNLAWKKHLNLRWHLTSPPQACCSISRKATTNLETC